MSIHNTDSCYFSTVITQMISDGTVFRSLKIEDFLNAIEYFQLNSDDAITILKNSREHYSLEDRLTILRHMDVYFGETNSNIGKIIEFLSEIDDILQLKCIYNIINALQEHDNHCLEKIKYQITNLNEEVYNIKKIMTTMDISMKNDFKSLQQQFHINTNKNIIALRSVKMSNDNFFRISKIFDKIAEEDDVDAINS